MVSQEMVSASYKIIDGKANSNSIIQGITGLVGFPYTMIADGAVIFTHYGDMFNEIRALFNREALKENALRALLTGMYKEVLFDLIGDKCLGNIPVIGVYFNAICAKTLTWRLGILFTMLSARGENINTDSVKNAMKLIRMIFPQEDAFLFKQPSYANFETMVLSIENNTVNEFDQKIRKALACFI